jgi:DDE family transposase/transposase-like protein DUF772
VRARRHALLDVTFQDTRAATYRAEPGGTEAVEAGMLARATLVQAYCHVGDREAVARTVMDQRWQWVLDGLGAARPPLSPGTLDNCRRRLMAHTLDHLVLERTLAWAEQTGGCGARQRRAALDSTPRCGAGRVEDPVHLLGQAWRKAVGRAARALGASAEARLGEAGLVLVGHSRLQAARDRDWGQPQARAQALRGVLAEVERWPKWREQPQRLAAAVPPMQDVRDTSTQLGTQDTAPAPEGGPGGTRLKKQVAPDRRLAIEDADRRHGRTSRATPCKGFPEHGGLDLESQVPRAVVVRPATEPEQAAVALLAETLEPPPGLLQLASALGSMASPRLAPGAEPGGSIMARPWPQGGTLVTTDDCTFDCAHGHVTCPGGPTVSMLPGKNAQFPASACEVCPQRAPCTPARSGQGSSRSIREDEPFQHTLRATMQTQRGRASRRKRTAIAPAISHHVAHQGRRVRSTGLRKNQCDGRRQAAVSTLQVAAHYAEARQLAS